MKTVEKEYKNIVAGIERRISNLDKLTEYRFYAEATELMFIINSSRFGHNSHTHHDALAEVLFPKLDELLLKLETKVEKRSSLREKGKFDHGFVNYVFNQILKIRNMESISIAVLLCHDLETKIEEELKCDCSPTYHTQLLDYKKELQEIVLVGLMKKGDRDNRLDQFSQSIKQLNGIVNDIETLSNTVNQKLIFTDSLLSEIIVTETQVESLYALRNQLQFVTKKLNMSIKLNLH